MTLTIALVLTLTRHSGSFAAVISTPGMTDIISLLTEVSFSASSWKDTLTDFPLEFQFGYYVQHLEHNYGVSMYIRLSLLNSI